MRTPIMSARLLPILVLIVALAGGFSTLQVGHLSDDWALLHYASEHGNSAQWTGPWLGMENLRFHRPLFTGLYAWDWNWFGSDPYWPHALQIAAHALSAALLYAALVLLRVPVFGAAFGAVVFAIHPFLPGATGWLAGRCGTFAGLFTLATMVLWLRADTARSAWLWRGAALLGAAAAALTRESGYLALVLPLTFDVCAVTRARPAPRGLLLRHAPFAVAGLLLLLLRHAALGTVGGGYPDAAGLVAGGPHAVAALQQAGLALLQLVGAVPPMVDAQRLVAIATGVGTLAVVLLGWIHTTPTLRRVILGLLTLFATQLVLLLLLDPTLHPSTGQRWYAAIALFAGILGVLAAPLFTRKYAFAPLWLLPALLYGHVMVQGELVAANAETRELLHDAESMIRAEKTKRVEQWKIDLGPIVFSCLPESHGGLPTFQWGVGDALSTPFLAQPLPAPIYPVQRFMYLGDHTAWKMHPPVEALLHIRGRQPYAIGPANPLAHEFGKLRSADIHSLIEALGTKPWDWKDYFSGELTVLEPPNAASETLPANLAALSLPLRVDSTGCEAVEFFCFLESVCMRHRIAASGADLRVDLGGVLAPYARFHGRTTEIHIVAVGWRADAPSRPKLSRVITWRATR